MKVAAVVLSFNSEEYLLECIGRILKQSMPFDRIILVDNGSTINKGIIEKAKDKRIMFVKNEYNLGFARGNNEAIKLWASDCDYVAIINSDAFIKEDWLEEMIKAAGKCPGYSSFASKVIMADGITIESAGDMIAFTGRPTQRGRGKGKDKNFNEPGDVMAACGCAAMYMVEDFMRVGGFDERLFCYYEDVDLGLRFLRMGQRCYYVPTAEVNHLGSKTAGKQSDFSIYYGNRNRDFIIYKNFDKIALFVMAPWIFMLLIAGIINCNKENKLKIAVEAKKDLVRLICMETNSTKESATKKLSLADISSFVVMDPGLNNGIEKIKQRIIGLARLPTWSNNR